MLARGRLTLGEFDRDTSFRHLVPQQAMERFRLGCLQEVVVLVVIPEALRNAVAVLGDLVPRILEDVVLELGPGLDRDPGLAGSFDLALEDGPRRDGDLLMRLLIDRVGQDQGRLLEPREDAQRIPDRRGDPVAIAGLPVHQAEALWGVHLHVRTEQVRAEVGAVVDDAVEERVALDALAHKPALHISQGHDDRVDPAVADHLLQFDQTRVLVVMSVGAHRTSLWDALLESGGPAGDADRPSRLPRWIPATSRWSPQRARTLARSR